MLRSNEDVEKLLNHSNNGLNRVKTAIKIIGAGNHGNGGNIHEVPQTRYTKEDKSTVAVLAELVGNKTTSILTGTNQDTVSKFRNGKGTNGKPDGELKSKTEEKLDKIVEKAVDRVDQLMDIFVESKISELKANEIPGAAEKVVNMFDKLRRRNEGSVDGYLRPQVILYAPKQINVENLITKEVEG